MSLVVAERIGKRYRQGSRRLWVLRDVSLSVDPGELVLVVGPSGSGKTTLLSILAGLLQPTVGSLSLCSQPISRMTQAAVAQVRRRHLGFVFQSYNLFGALSALDNVAEPLAMKGMRFGEARALAKEALAEVGLGERLQHRPCDLSGGEKQRVAVARAIAGKPRLIFGDEPTAALDGDSAAAVVKLLRGAVTSERSVVLVTHDRRLERHADRVIRLEDGQLAEAALRRTA